MLSTYHPAIFNSPKFIDESTPEWIPYIPLVFYLCQFLKPSLFIDLEVHSGNAYNAVCQAMARQETPKKCFGFLGSKNFNKPTPEIDENIAIFKNHNIKHYGSFSSLLPIESKEGLNFIENESIDLLHIDSPKASELLAMWIPKISPLGIVLLHDLKHHASFWEKLKRQYAHCEFPQNKGLGILFIGDRSNERIAPETVNFLTSGFAKDLFGYIGDKLSEKSGNTSQVSSKIKAKKLSSITQTLEVAFSAHIQSWRWKIGNALISMIERMLLRKKVKLTSDDIPSLIDQLKTFKWEETTFNSNKELKRSFFRKKICRATTKNDTKKLCIGFAVSANHQETKAGDFFTAQELALACEQELGWETRFLSREKGWYDLEEIDILITLLHHYEFGNVKNARPHLIQIAWVRNRVDEWIESGYLKYYDFILCSSQKIVDSLSQLGLKSCILFPIATNPQRFKKGKFRKELSSDYCFTGSYWQHPREIESQLDPEALGEHFALFGTGWEGHTRFEKYWKGFVSYNDLPDVYASTKLVIDDAVDVTKIWNSINSRVFDALGAGKLVLTNGKEGVHQLFENQVPTFESESELTQQLRFFLENEAYRKELAAKLQKEVIENHTYQNRAKKLNQVLKDFLACKNLNISVKIGVPDCMQAELWGDYHFANGLSKALKKLGHAVRIDFKADWYHPAHTSDDLVILLRGLSAYNPDPKQMNILWLISHPEKVTLSEIEKFDHVFVASATYADKLAEKSETPVTPLMQCTDPEVFFPVSKNHFSTNHQFLFVGNSRDQKRKIVQDAIDLKLDLAVYGTRWKNIIPAKMVHGSYIPNGLLNTFYSNSKVVLNDHWPSMRKNGFISNRIFDAGACGSCIISDFIPELDQIFETPSLLTYQDQNDLAQKVAWLSKNPEKVERMKKNIRAFVINKHTFDHRVKTILEKVSALMLQQNDHDEL